MVAIAQQQIESLAEDANLGVDRKKCLLKVDIFGRAALPIVVERSV